MAASTKTEAWRTLGPSESAIAAGWMEGGSSAAMVPPLSLGAGLAGTSDRLESICRKDGEFWARPWKASRVGSAFRDENGSEGSARFEVFS